MDLNTFKRLYSNEDDTEQVMKKFIEEFDFENNTVWFCDYMYNESLSGPAFMSANRVGGFLQRSEKLARGHFASMCITRAPDASHNEIHGFWVVPGAEPSDVRAVPDSESYDWHKADLSDAAHVDKIIKLGAWTVENFQDGKILK
ncbi:hypothetical protein P9112_000228 [Eukaryota sp. TZLM1-RC]